MLLILCIILLPILQIHARSMSFIYPCVKSNQKTESKALVYIISIYADSVFRSHRCPLNKLIKFANYMLVQCEVFQLLSLMIYKGMIKNLSEQPPNSVRGDQQHENIKGVISDDINYYLQLKLTHLELYCDGCGLMIYCHKNFSS